MAASRDCEEKRRKVDSKCSALARIMHQPSSLKLLWLLCKCSFEVLPHATYYPDLVPSDFYLFTNLKTNLCGRNFGSNESIIDTVDYLRDQEEGFYFKGISKLEQHWRKHTEAK